jgi:toxin ParE1/3/4
MTVLTGPAKRDLRKTAAYIVDELKSPVAANHLLDDTETGIATLTDSPYIYPLVRDEYLAEKGIRLFSVRNYIVFYAVREENKTIVILRFLYGRRDWMNILKKDDHA